MSITSLNFEGYAHNAETSHKNKSIKWKPPFAASFLEHTLPIFASVPLKKNPEGLISSTEVFNTLENTPIITTPNGDMAGKNILQLIKLMYFAKRGDFIVGSQIRGSRLATYTPLFLYAHKLYNDVPYSSWDKADTRLRPLLGMVLQHILDVKKIPDTFDAKIERELALTFKTGAKAGTMEKPYNYKCVISELNGVTMPKTAIMMLLQLWLANSSVRNTDSMILDPLEWDNAPEPLDVETSLPPTKTPEPKKKTFAEDLPW